MFRGIGVGYYVTAVNIKRRDDKAGKTGLRMSHIMKGSECPGKISWLKNFLEILQKGSAVTRVSFKSNLIKYVRGYGGKKYCMEGD